MNEKEVLKMIIKSESKLISSQINKVRYCNKCNEPITEYDIKRDTHNDGLCRLCRTNFIAKLKNKSKTSGFKGITKGGREIKRILIQCKSDTFNQFKFIKKSLELEKRRKVTNEEVLNFLISLN